MRLSAVLKSFEIALALPITRVTEDAEPVAQLVKIVNSSHQNIVILDCLSCLEVSADQRQIANRFNLVLEEEVGRQALQHENGKLE